MMVLFLSNSHRSGGKRDVWTKLEGHELEHKGETNLEEIGGEERPSANRHAILPFEPA